MALKSVSETTEIISAETRKICELLGEKGEGDTLTYMEIQIALGASEFTDRHRSALYRARKSILNERGFVFGTIPTVGVKRLNPSEIVKTAKSGIRRIGRVCRKSQKSLACADYSKLNGEEKVQHNLSMSVFGAIALSASPSTSKKLEEKVRNSGVILSIGETLEHFK